MRLQGSHDRRLLRSNRLGGPWAADRSEERRTAKQSRNRLRAPPSDLLPARTSRNSETEKVRQTLQGRPGESLCDLCSLAYATPAHAHNLGDADPRPMGRNVHQTTRVAEGPEQVCPSTQYSPVALPYPCCWRREKPRTNGCD